MNRPPDDRPLEAADDPATAHARTLAALLGETGQRKRNQAAAAFGIPTDEPEENPDGVE